VPHRDFRARWAGLDRLASEITLRTATSSRRPAPRRTPQRRRPTRTECQPASSPLGTIRLCLVFSPCDRCLEKWLKSVTFCDIALLCDCIMHVGRTPKGDKSGRRTGPSGRRATHRTRRTVKDRRERTRVSTCIMTYRSPIRAQKIKENVIPISHRVTGASALASGCRGSVRRRFMRAVSR
jgi:hypothetical protein